MQTPSPTNGGVQLASTTPTLKNVPEAVRRCIQDCLECANICDQTMAFCLRQGGKHAEANHISLLRDCAESCSLAASMMSRGSRFQKQHCAMCADICHACAESCDKLGPMPEMQTCTEACRRCEQSCRTMTK
jgi:hypothetical protein